MVTRITKGIMMKPWRDAASIILSVRHKQKVNTSLPSTAFQYDYVLLTLKRHKDSPFMPGNYVFPGGKLESADADLKWESLFSKFGFDNSSFLPLIPKNTARPPIFQSIRNELPREISLRISAIRETFEECGVLLCRQSKKRGFLSEWAENYPITRNEMINWQNKIHDDANEFYKMCEGLQCYPDLWALHEWSNWLTPTSYKGKRFDTIFFMACMESQPDAEYDVKEMEALRWNNPQDSLSPASGITLAPPQEYEIARIAKFESLDNLLDFVVDRSKIGVHLNMPVRAQLSDGRVYLLPGDSMYPEAVSLTEKLELDRSNMTISEFRNLADVKNRLEFYELEVKRVVSENLETKDGHLPPMPIETVRIKTDKS